MAVIFIIGGSFGMALKTAVSQGAKRGLFSNEAGMGSTPHAHAQANVKSPHEQGVVAMVGVFIDTFIVLTLNALVFIFLGTLASNDLVWELSDMFNQLMVIPNAIALLALTGMVVASIKEK